MASEQTDVSRFSDEQVRALLALGEESPSKQATKILLALKRAVRQAKSDQLDLLVLDLKRSVLSDSPGPLAFQRLITISDQDEQFLRGRSFLDVLASRESSSNSLKHLLDYGRLLKTERFPASTRLAGEAIASLAKIAIIARRDQASGTDMTEITTDILRALESTNK